MATITILCQTDDSQVVFALVEKVKAVIVDIPGAMLDVRYRTTP